MSLYILFLVFITVNVIKSNDKIDKRAVTIVPVADLCAQPLCKVYNTDKNIEQFYNTIPFAEDKGYYSCARVHQLLFNEIITIKQEKGLEVECEVPNIFFQTQNGIPIKKFWTLKKNIQSIDSLKKEGYDTSIIPDPYVDGKGKILMNSSILTLKHPWYDPVTTQSYSAGTRFKRHAVKDSKRYYAIKIFDFKRHKNRISYIPQEYSVINYSKNKDICCRNFVKILKEWANLYNSFIPYVTGGCSFVRTYKTNSFAKEEKRINGNNISFWNRPDKVIPKTGMDCSCLIARAAQICGIPYYFKNTTTLAQHLNLLKAPEKLEEGDLVWYAGHVLIVSDIKNNKILESTGYPFGYGKIHERPLSKIFKGIKNYQDLLKCYQNQEGLIRLNNKGEKARDIQKFTVFKIKSSWNYDKKK